MLIKAKFDLHLELPNRKPNGLFSCTDCIYHKNGYIKPCKSFTFKLTNLLLETTINFLIATVKMFYIS